MSKSTHGKYYFLADIKREQFLYIHLHRSLHLSFTCKLRKAGSSLKCSLVSHVLYIKQFVSTMCKQPFDIVSLREFCMHVFPNLDNANSS